MFASNYCSERRMLEKKEDRMLLPSIQYTEGASCLITCSLDQAHHDFALWINSVIFFLKNSQSFSQPGNPNVTVNPSDPGRLPSSKVPNFTTAYAEATTDDADQYGCTKRDVNHLVCSVPNAMPVSSFRAQVRYCPGVPAAHFTAAPVSHTVHTCRY